MSTFVTWTAILLVSWVVGIAAFGLAHPDHDEGPRTEIFRVGKNGQVNIRYDVILGVERVKRGKYLFAHAVEGEAHRIALSRIDKKANAQAPFDVPVQIIPRRETAKRTAIIAKEAADRSLRVTLIEVAGENVEHIPQPTTRATR